MDICSVEGCERTRTTKVFCRMHYELVRIYGDPGPVEGMRKGVKPSPRGPCSVEGCEEIIKIISSQLCAKHYERMRRYGSLELKKNHAKFCFVEDCGAPCFAGGMCSLHYQRARIGKAPTDPKRLDHNGGDRQYKRYKITEAEVMKMLEDQNYCCKLCGISFEIKRRAVDHCHATGIVRGILCYPCNMGLGGFDDSVDLMYRAIKYVETQGNI